jgi:hypothetical protein
MKKLSALCRIPLELFDYRVKAGETAGSKIIVIENGELMSQFFVAIHGDAAEGAAMMKQMKVPADVLLGRKTFEMFAAFWPQHADIWPEVHTATKYVASNTITSSEWKPAVFLTGDIGNSKIPT